MSGAIKMFGDSDRVLSHYRSTVTGSTDGTFLVDPDYCDLLISIEFVAYYSEGLSNRISVRGNGLVTEVLKSLYGKTITKFTADDGNGYIINLGRYDRTLSTPCVQSFDLVNNSTFRSGIRLKPVYDRPYSNRIYVFELDESLISLDPKTLTNALVYHDKIVRGRSKYGKRWSTFDGQLLNYDLAAENHIISNLLYMAGITQNKDNIAKMIFKVRQMLGSSPGLLNHSTRQPAVYHRQSEIKSEPQDLKVLRQYILSLINLYETGEQKQLDKFIDNVIRMPELKMITELTDQLSKFTIKSDMFGSHIIPIIDRYRVFRRPTIKIYPSNKKYLDVAMSSYGLRRPTKNSKNQDNPNSVVSRDVGSSTGSQDAATDILIVTYPHERGFENMLETWLDMVRIGGLVIFITQEKLNTEASIVSSKIIASVIRNDNEYRTPASSDQIDNKVLQFASSNNRDTHLYKQIDSPGPMIGQIIKVFSRTYA
ncbi:MAG: hypothetical protein GY751_13865 [Bacteroidetes bacterium]|nr:hypothetical protein [Bacteroidota bacterium]